MIATVEQAQEIDRISQEKFSLSAELLMESAGVLAADEISKQIKRKKINGTVAVLCGPGNNGADALVVARHLSAHGIREVEIFLLSDNTTLSPLLKLQVERLKALNLNIR